MNAKLIVASAALSCLAAASAGAQVTLVANPQSVVQGQSSVLTTTVTVTQPDGTTVQVSPPSKTVTPSVTTTYASKVGTLVAQATVTVTAAPPPAAAAWSSICNTTMVGTNCPFNASFPAGRGYNYSLPFDDVNGEAILFAGYYADTTIYSNALWAVNARTRSVRLIKRVDPKGGYGCADATQSPYVGHPNGFAWTQNGVWYTVAELCVNYNAAATSRMDLATHAMLPVIPRWQYSVLFGGASDTYTNSVGQQVSCDGTADKCGKIGWESGSVYVPNYGKALVGLNGDQYSLHMTEFDGSDYADVTDLLRGADGIACASGSQQCPQPTYMHAATFVTDGTYVYVFGGTDNSGNQFNNVYRYDPVTHTFLRLDPPDGVKPPATHTAFPMAAFDSRRNRIVFYAGDDDLWQFSAATRMWSRFAASGHGPVVNGLDPISWGTGNGAAYDPVQDAVIFTYQRGQSQAEGIFILQFSGQ